MSFDVYNLATDMDEGAAGDLTKAQVRDALVVGGLKTGTDISDLDLLILMQVISESVVQSGNTAPSGSTAIANESQAYFRYNASNELVSISLSPTGATTWSTYTIPSGGTHFAFDSGTSPPQNNDAVLNNNQLYYQIDSSNNIVSISFSRATETTWTTYGIASGGGGGTPFAFSSGTAAPDDNLAVMGTNQVYYREVPGGYLISVSYSASTADTWTTILNAEFEFTDGTTAPDHATAEIGKDQLYFRRTGAQIVGISYSEHTQSSWTSYPLSASPFEFTRGTDAPDNADAMVGENQIYYRVDMDGDLVSVSFSSSASSAWVTSIVPTVSGTQENVGQLLATLTIPTGSRTYSDDQPLGPWVLASGVPSGVTVANNGTIVDGQVNVPHNKINGGHFGYWIRVRRGGTTTTPVFDKIIPLNEGVRGTIRGLVDNLSIRVDSNPGATSSIFVDSAANQTVSVTQEITISLYMAETAIGQRGFDGREGINAVSNTYEGTFYDANDVTAAGRVHWVNDANSADMTAYFSDAAYAYWQNLRVGSLVTARIDAGNYVQARVTAITVATNPMDIDLEVLDVVGYVNGRTGETIHIDSSQAVDGAQGRDGVNAVSNTYQGTFFIADQVTAAGRIHWVNDATSADLTAYFSDTAYAYWRNLRVGSLVTARIDDDNYVQARVSAITVATNPMDIDLEVLEVVGYVNGRTGETIHIDSSQAIDGTIGTDGRKGINAVSVSYSGTFYDTNDVTQAGRIHWINDANVGNTTLYVPDADVPYWRDVSVGDLITGRFDDNNYVQTRVTQANDTVNPFYFEFAVLDVVGRVNGRTGQTIHIDSSRAPGGESDLDGYLKSNLEGFVIWTRSATRPSTPNVTYNDGIIGISASWSEIASEPPGSDPLWFSSVAIHLQSDGSVDVQVGTPILFPQGSSSGIVPYVDGNEYDQGQYVRYEGLEYYVLQDDDGTHGPPNMNPLYYQPLASAKLRGLRTQASMQSSNFTIDLRKNPGDPSVSGGRYNDAELVFAEEAVGNAWVYDEDTHSWTLAATSANIAVAAGQTWQQTIAVRNDGDTVATITEYGIRIRKNQGMSGSETENIAHFTIHSNNTINPGSSRTFGTLTSVAASVDFVHDDTVRYELFVNVAPGTSLSNLVITDTSSHFGLINATTTVNFAVVISDIEFDDGNRVWSIRDESGDLHGVLSPEAVPVDTLKAWIDERDVIPETFYLDTDTPTTQYETDAFTWNATDNRFDIPTGMLRERPETVAHALYFVIVFRTNEATPAVHAVLPTLPFGATTTIVQQFSTNLNDWHPTRNMDDDKFFRLLINGRATLGFRLADIPVDEAIVLKGNQRETVPVEGFLSFSEYFTWDYIKAVTWHGLPGYFTYRDGVATYNGTSAILRITGFGGLPRHFRGVNRSGNRSQIETYLQIIHRLADGTETTHRVAEQSGTAISFSGVDVQNIPMAFEAGLPQLLLSQGDSLRVNVVSDPVEGNNFEITGGNMEIHFAGSHTVEGLELLITDGHLVRRDPSLPADEQDVELADLEENFFDIPVEPPTLYFYGKRAGTGTNYLNQTGRLSPRGLVYRVGDVAFLPLSTVPNELHHGAQAGWVNILEASDVTNADPIPGFTPEDFSFFEIDEPGVYRILAKVTSIAHHNESQGGPRKSSMALKRINLNTLTLTTTEEIEDMTADDSHIWLLHGTSLTALTHRLHTDTAADISLHNTSGNFYAAAELEDKIYLFESIVGMSHHVAIYDVDSRTRETANEFDISTTDLPDIVAAIGTPNGNLLVLSSSGAYHIYDTSGISQRSGTVPNPGSGTPDFAAVYHHGDYYFFVERAEDQVVALNEDNFARDTDLEFDLPSSNNEVYGAAVATDNHVYITDVQTGGQKVDVFDFDGTQYNTSSDEVLDVDTDTIRKTGDTPNDPTGMAANVSYTVDAHNVEVTFPDNRFYLDMRGIGYSLSQISGFVAISRIGDLNE